MAMYRPSHDVRPAPAAASPTLAIGCFASICRDQLGDELLAFAQRCPGVDVGIYEMARAELHAALQTGEIALAVMPGAPDADAPALKLWDDAVMVALAAQHPLAAAAAIDPAALAEALFLVSRYRHGWDMHRFLARTVFPDAGLRTKLHDHGMKELLARVARNEGVALVCASRCTPPPAGLVLRPFATDRASFPVHAEWKQAAPEPMLATLLEMLAANR